MKIEWKVFHRRDAEHAEMIYLFSLPLRRRQRKTVMPFPPAWKPSGLEAGQGLVSSGSLREALDLSLFCPLSRKGKKVFLCDLPPGRRPYGPGAVPLAKPRRGGTSGR